MTMGMGTKTRTLYNSTLVFKIALLCLVLYSLRSDVLVGGDGVGTRRRGGLPTSTTTPPSPIWRRRPVRKSTTTTSTESSVQVTTSDPFQELLPEDFLNTAPSDRSLPPEEEEVIPPPEFFPTAQRIFQDPFMLVGDDNILDPTPTGQARRKVFRRTRRRRIKKLRGGTSSTQEPASYTTTEEEFTGEEFGSLGSASSENANKLKHLSTRGSTTSTTKPTSPSTTSRTTTMKLEVVPIDSLQGYTEEVSTESSSSSFLPTTGTGSPLSGPTSTTGGNNNIKPGFYTRHQKGGGGRKRAKSKENLWKHDTLTAAVPSFSVELFDNSELHTEEINNSNLDKRESSSKSPPPSSSTSPPRKLNHHQNFNLFSLQPTALTSMLLTEGDLSTDESIASPFLNNTSIPISTELQNSLQFTLQNLHPLLNSDSVLTQSAPKIPENKTVAITHSLADNPADTPIAPDLRFLPAHLRKSHPLLSQETFLNGDLSGSKVGPRLNVYPGLHSIKNRPTSGTTERTRAHFSSTFSAVPPSPSTTSTTTRRTTTTATTTTTSTEPSTTTTRKTTTTSTAPPPPKVYPTPTATNVHLESLGNLKITEIVYPTNAAPPVVSTKGSLDMKVFVAPPHKTSTTTAATTTTSKGTTSTTTWKSTSPILPASGRPTSAFDNDRSPPLILMGSDSNMGSAIEQPPPQFNDDLLLEELIKGFEPPKPSTTTTTTTTTTTPKTTTTTFKTTTTTKKAPPPPPPPSIPPPSQDEETQQLLQLLNLLNQQSSTTEGIKSTSPISTSSSTSNPTKVDEDFLKNLALLENLLSPTAKTMIKEAVDSGTTEKIIKPSPSTTSGGGAGQQGLSNSDLHQIFALLDAMSTSTTTPPPPPTTTPTPTKAPQIVHPALQNMLNLLTNPGAASQPKPSVFNIPEPPKPVPTSSSFDLLSQLFNLNPAGAAATPQQTQQPPPQNPLGGFGSALGGLFESFMPKKQPSNREAATSASNPLLSFFQPPQEPVATPAPGPYYWFDVNAFLGQDPNAGAMSGIRPKFGTRDYFLKVRRRRNSMETYG